jgi:hypothetical protein
MGIIIYNALGMVITFVPAVICCLAFVYVPDGYGLMLVPIWGSVVLLWDLVYRIVAAGREWYLPRKGGHLYFIPVWIYGAVVLAWYMHSALKSGHWIHL